MKKHTSVFMLMAQISFGKILAIILASTIVQLGVTYYLFTEKFFQIYNIEYIAKYLHIPFILSLVLAVLVLASTNFERKGKERYTLMRLSIKERTVYFWHCAYNFLAFSLIYLMQILTVIGISYMYVKIAPPEYVSELTVYLPFFRNDFLKNILPLESEIQLTINITAIFVLALLSAHIPRKSAFSQREAIEHDEQA